MSSASGFAAAPVSAPSSTSAEHADRRRDGERRGAAIAGVARRQASSGPMPVSRTRMSASGTV